jgi:hypothetical protein
MKKRRAVLMSMRGGVALRTRALGVNFKLKSLQLKNACIALVAATVFAIALSLSVLPGYAQQGPFADLSGAWVGAGSITLSGGTHEPIRCRANYNTQSGGNDLKLALRCASDSYNVDFQGNARNNGGNFTGNWFEATNHAAGQFIGSVKGNRIDARIEGQTFAAFLDVTTHGNRQSVSLRSPGSRVSSVTISLKRR